MNESNCYFLFFSAVKFRRESWPPEPKTVSKGDSPKQAERTGCGGGARDGSTDGDVRRSSKLGRGFPRHVAVIMDGNRRFGRVKYQDPLKVYIQVSNSSE